MGIAHWSRKKLPDYFAFPKLKMELKGDRYATINEIQKSVRTKLKTVSTTDFFVSNASVGRSRQPIAVNGVYFE